MGNSFGIIVGARTCSPWLQEDLGGLMYGHSHQSGSSLGMRQSSWGVGGRNVRGGGSCFSSSGPVLAQIFPLAMKRQPPFSMSPFPPSLTVPAEPSSHHGAWRGLFFQTPLTPILLRDLDQAGCLVPFLPCQPVGLLSAGLLHHIHGPLRSVY